MPSNPVKTKGNSGACFSCGGNIVCNEKTYNNQVQLQWQNADGKAHYSQDGKCKSVSAKTENVVQSIKTQKIRLDDIKLDSVVLEKGMKISREAIQFLKMIEYVAYEELGQDAVPAHVGLYVNQVANKLLGIPNLQEVLESLGEKK